MSHYIFYPATRSPALLAAAEALKRKGYGVVSRPCESVTHLLLPVPSFDADGTIKGGGEPEDILKLLPKDVTVVGGMLSGISGRKLDLLEDAEYLSANAYITAHCALRLAMLQLPVTMRGCKVLIIGWGRIGKCLAGLLKNLGADVTVAARNPKDKAMIHALGYCSVDIAELALCLGHFRLLYNTVPCPVLDSEQLAACHPSCVKIELASKDGIVGDDIVIARGLPGLHMPESSGKLIAHTFLRLCYGR